MKVYYAHCLSNYNTKQEERDLEFLAKLGYTVVNPNEPAYRIVVDSMKAEGKTSEEVMKYFEGVVLTCSVLAFRALPDGRIPAGVFKEIKVAKENSIFVFELPSGILSREMTVEQTREYLREIGQR